MKHIVFILILILFASAGIAQFIQEIEVSTDASELAPLVLEGHELHKSLVTRELSKIRHVPRSVVGKNPYLSAESECFKVPLKNREFLSKS